jgi:hypothetical protein
MNLSKIENILRQNHSLATVCCCACPRDLVAGGSVAHCISHPAFQANVIRHITGLEKGQNSKF